MFKSTAHKTQAQRNFAQLTQEGRISYSGSTPLFKPEVSTKNAPLTEEELESNRFHNERLHDFFSNSIKHAKPVNYPTDIQNQFASLVESGQIHYPEAIPMFKPEFSTPSKPLTSQEIRNNLFHNEKLYDYFEYSIKKASNKNQPAI